MVRVPGEWLEKARFFYERARVDLEQGAYWAACFEAQQAVELILKGLQVGLSGSHEFTHDLARLLRGLEALGLRVPRELYPLADALTPTMPWRGILVGSLSSTMRMRIGGV